MYQKELCVVLRHNSYRDNDRMLCLFSKDSGRIDALCRGCRKQGSPLLAASEPFCCGEYTFYVKKDRYYVNQCEVKNQFFSIHKDVRALCAASVLLEACEKAIVPDQPNPRLFSLLVNCLYALDKDQSRHREVFAFFAVKLMDVLGQRPDFTNCSPCAGQMGEFCRLCGGRREWADAAREMLGEKNVAITKRMFPVPKGFANTCQELLRAILETRLKTLEIYQSLGKE